MQRRPRFVAYYQAEDRAHIVRYFARTLRLSRQAQIYSLVFRGFGVYRGLGVLGFRGLGVSGFRGSGFWGFRVL